MSSPPSQTIELHQPYTASSSISAQKAFSPAVRSELLEALDEVEWARQHADTILRDKAAAISGVCRHRPFILHPVSPRERLAPRAARARGRSSPPSASRLHAATVHTPTRQLLHSFRSDSASRSQPAKTGRDDPKICIKIYIGTPQMRSAFRLHARQTKGRILAEIDRRGAQVLRAGAPAQ